MSERIYHVAAGADWDRARREGAYRPASLATEGFVHASRAEQLPGVARRFFAGRRDLVLLTVDPARLACEVRWEEGEPGETFPHVYGPIDLQAVVDVRPFDPGA